MATSLVEVDLSKLEYPVLLKWAGQYANDFKGGVVRFDAPRRGTVVETTEGRKTDLPMGYYGSSWAWSKGDWEFAVVELPYDPLQNGDTDDDI